MQLLQPDAIEKDPVIKLPAIGKMPASFHVMDRDSALAINAALVTGRPLLVRGEPGTGKSQLARAAAVSLGRAFLSHAVDARTETRDLLWTVDAVARLAKAQVLGARRDVDPAQADEEMAPRRFVRPGPLWWAFEWDSAAAQARDAGAEVLEKPQGWEPEMGVVVLIDELDKADPSVPNGLLDALGHGCFHVEGVGPVGMGATPPLILLTTNEDRSLPDAFLRRCWVRHLALDADRGKLIGHLKVCGRAHFRAEKCADDVLELAAELLANAREKSSADRIAPGLAEYIDLLRAVTEQRKGAEAQKQLLELISRFALEKHPPEPRA